MRLAYLTIDEVNFDLARRFAEDCDATLVPLFFVDGPPDGKFDGLLYDFDHLPNEERARILTDLLRHRSSCPVALHSYHLGEEDTNALHKNGVAVFARLDPGVLLFLRRAACQRRPEINGEARREGTDVSVRQNNGPAGAPLD
jgi:hypothetical protein